VNTVFDAAVERVTGQSRRVNTAHMSSRAFPHSGTARTRGRILSHALTPGSRAATRRERGRRDEQRGAALSKNRSTKLGSSYKRAHVHTVREHPTPCVGRHGDNSCYVSLLLWGRMFQRRSHVVRTLLTSVVVTEPWYEDMPRNAAGFPESSVGFLVRDQSGNTVIFLYVRQRSDEWADPAPVWGM